MNARLALMLFQASRLRARVGAEGELLLLEQQDRSLWDRGMIDRGLMHLELSMSGEELTEFHVQAGIASVRALAPSFESGWANTRRRASISWKRGSWRRTKWSGRFSRGGSRCWGMRACREEVIHTSCRVIHITLARQGTFWPYFFLFNPPISTCAASSLERIALASEFRSSSVLAISNFALRSTTSFNSSTSRGRKPASRRNFIMNHVSRST
jgi:hypothetical protein